MSMSKQSILRVALMAVATAVWMPSIAASAPIALQNATATFSQAGFLASHAIDGSATSGWAIAGDTIDSIVNQTAVFETQADAGFTLGTVLTFTLDQNFGGQHALGGFRLSATTDNRSLFADGFQTAGDVSANWIQLTPISAVATGGALLAIQGNNSILAGGPSPNLASYQVTAVTTMTGITGFRLEVLENASLPFNGPGRQPTNGNFVLTNFAVDGAPVRIDENPVLSIAEVPEPSSLTLLALGVAGLSRRMRQGRKRGA